MCKACIVLRKYSVSSEKIEGAMGVDSQPNDQTTGTVMFTDYPHAVILVSHDRFFLDAVVTRISEIALRTISRPVSRECNRHTEPFGQRLGEHAPCGGALAA